MRVLQITPGYPPTLGGVERHVEALSAALVRRGHSVTVLSLDGRTTSGARPGQVEVLRLPGRLIGPFLVARRLRRTVRALAAEHDVVHVHNYHSPLPLAVLRSRCRRPVVVTTHFHGDGHGILARIAHVGYRPLVRAALRLAAAVVCVSRAEADHVVTTFPEHRGRVHVVPNGLRPLDTAAALPAHWREPLVVCVSRLEAYKRVDMLVRALAMVMGPWRCVIVGSGPQRKDLEELTADLGLADRVTFAGTLTDTELDALLLKARVCVQPSSREAFGMALLDGIGAGCRVVASDIPPHSELAVLAGGAVRLWPADGDAVSLAGAVVQGLCDVAPAAVPDLPTWDDAARRLEEVYQRAAPAAQPSPTTPAAPAANGSVEVGLEVRLVDGGFPGSPRTPYGRGDADRGTPE